MHNQLEDFSYKEFMKIMEKIHESVSSQVFYQDVRFYEPQELLSGETKLSTKLPGFFHYNYLRTLELSKFLYKVSGVFYSTSSFSLFIEYPS